MRIGIFGGTFDPPHVGHISIVKKILQLGLADRIIFVISAFPPHKPGKRISGFIHRLKMLELATKGVPEFEISDVEERRRPEPSYTYRTMEYFGMKYPEDDLYLILGGDSLLQLHTWYRGTEIPERWNIITYPRPNEKLALEELRRFWPVKTAEKLFQSVIDGICFDVSATGIRKAVGEGRTPEEKMVSPEVAEYIRVNGLYRDE